MRINVRANERGFTLIEVLIALMILAIAMTAAIKLMQGSVRNTEYLRDRMTAHWVGLNVINSVQAGLFPAPKAGDPLQGEEMMFHKSWHWEINVSAVKSIYYERIEVKVSNQAEQQKATVVGFIKRDNNNDQ